MNQEIIKFEEQKKSIVEQVRSLVVKDQESYQKGASLKVIISAFKKMLEIYFNPKVSLIKEKYDEEKAQRDKYLKPAKELDDEVKDKLKIYERQKEKEAAEAKRKADKERQDKIDAETVRRKVEAEQKVKDEAEVMGVDVAEVKVDEIEEVQPEDVEVAQPIATIDKVKGLGIRKVWKAKILNIEKVPRTYMIPDMVRLNDLARKNKSKMSIPGVEFYED